MANSRTHLTPEGPRPCRAHKRACKYGEDKHFDSPEAAQAAFEAAQAPAPKLSRGQALTTDCQDEANVRSFMKLYHRLRKADRHALVEDKLVAEAKERDSFGSKAMKYNSQEAVLKTISRDQALPYKAVRDLFFTGRALEAGTSYEEERAAYMARKELRILRHSATNDEAHAPSFAEAQRVFQQVNEEGEKFKDYSSLVTSLGARYVYWAVMNELEAGNRPEKMDDGFVKAAFEKHYPTLQKQRGELFENPAVKKSFLAMDWGKDEFVAFYNTGAWKRK